MKENIHPAYGDLLLILGEVEFLTKSAKPGKLILETDFREHPAWTKSSVNRVDEKLEKIAKFKSKFGNIGSMPGTKENNDDNADGSI